MLQTLLHFFVPSLFSSSSHIATHRFVGCKNIVLDQVQLQSQGLLHIDRLVAAASYRHHYDVQKALHVFKYQKLIDIQMPLSTLMLENRGDEWEDDDAVLCPVPLHWMRYLKRSFNQSMLLAERLHAETTFPLKKLLRRTRPTGHQAWRSRRERLSSVRGAFTVRRHTALPKHVILVDDIATTGATLDECAKVLKQAGVRRVDGWVVAKG